VSIDRAPRRDHWTIADEAAELRELAESAGGTVVSEFQLRCRQPHAATLLGKGQIAQLQGAVEENQADVVLFSQDLSPVQQRNLEEHLGCKTIDRTQLILDIFAQRARSQEGKLQVELAQLRYLMPRLVGKGIELSRLGGGIGTRGPGEQKLEVDRRRIRQRLDRLKEALERVSRRRQAIRQRRAASDHPVVALVGYTNAGKTTLLNCLTQAGAVAKDQMFSTLDPLARRVTLPGGMTMVLIDTVGFLHALPHHLVESFKSTLEEAHASDCLLHVLDAAHPLALEHLEAVQGVLADLQLDQHPVVTALNKTEHMNEAQRGGLLQRMTRPAVCISAKTGMGVAELLACLEEQLLLAREAPLSLCVPVDRADLLAKLYRVGQVLERESQPDGGIRIRAHVPKAYQHWFQTFLLDRVQ
jgi:GTP-binding protein HflX